MDDFTPLDQVEIKVYDIKPTIVDKVANPTLRGMVHDPITPKKVHVAKVKITSEAGTMRFGVFVDEDGNIWSRAGEDDTMGADLSELLGPEEHVDEPDGSPYTDYLFNNVSPEDNVALVEIVKDKIKAKVEDFINFVGDDADVLNI